MSLQRRFRAFDEAIKLKRYEENAELREKRDRVLRSLRDGLSRQFSASERKPRFDIVNQGSYAMGTGIRPLEGDYDIDVGVLFDVPVTDFPDPTEVKGWVYKAVQSHTANVEFRRNCITVNYVSHGEPKYHVDLAIYARSWWGGWFLARGKQHSSYSQKEWVNSNPKKLMAVVSDAYQGDDRSQFLRTIRYLKRWKDFVFRSDGHAAPTGISLTAAALEWFRPGRPYIFYSSSDYDDLSALEMLVEAMLEAFSWGLFGPTRLSVHLPVEPLNDLFEMMTEEQMLELKRKLEFLRETLAQASRAGGRDGAELLSRVFGPDFPV